MNTMNNNNNNNNNYMMPVAPLAAPGAGAPASKASSPQTLAARRRAFSRGGACRLRLQVGTRFGRRRSRFCVNERHHEAVRGRDEPVAREHRRPKWDAQEVCVQHRWSRRANSSASARVRCRVVQWFPMPSALCPVLPRTVVSP
jgi:hypothetical protein